MRRRTTMTATALAVIGSMVAGCGGSDDLLDRVAEPDAPISEEEIDELVERIEEEAAEAERAAEEAAGDAADPSGDSPAEPAPEPDPPPLDPADFPTIEERTIDAVVQYGVIEWDIQEMTVVDLDADLQPGEEPQGVEITFPTRVFNAGGGTASINRTPISLQWTDDVGDTFTVSAEADFRDVPAESFTSGEVRVHLDHEDRMLFDHDTAYLLVGQPGATPAVVPIGAAVEPVTRLIVRQDTDGWTFRIEGEDTGRQTIDDTITVVDAHVRWSDPDGRPLQDGNALLQINYTIENNGSAQTCSARGQGGWRLTLPDGDAVNDVGVTERCAGPGDTVTDVFTRFIIPSEEFAGEYVLWHGRRSGATEPSGEIGITLVDAEGSRLSERD